MEKGFYWGRKRYGGIKRSYFCNEKDVIIIFKK